MASYHLWDEVPTSWSGPPGFSVLPAVAVHPALQYLRLLFLPKHYPSVRASSPWRAVKSPRWGVHLHPLGSESPSSRKPSLSLPPPQALSSCSSALNSLVQVSSHTTPSSLFSVLVSFGKSRPLCGHHHRAVRELNIHPKSSVMLVSSRCLLPPQSQASMDLHSVSTVLSFLEVCI